MQRGPDAVTLPDMAAEPVTLPDGRAFYAQRHEVTIAEWNRCQSDGGCDLALRVKAGLDPARTPATGLNYLDAQQYIHWINDQTGRKFRLPTTEEWRVMAAGVLPEAPDPIFTDPSLSWASAYLVEGLASRVLREQGSFSTSADGIADLDGSVWEWTADCYDGQSGDRCPAFFLGGEHLAAMSLLVRDPARGGCAAGTPPAHIGMRLVSDASPGG